MRLRLTQIQFAPGTVRAMKAGASMDGFISAADGHTIDLIDDVVIVRSRNQPNDVTIAPLVNVWNAVPAPAHEQPEWSQWGAALQLIGPRVEEIVMARARETSGDGDNAKPLDGRTRTARLAKGAAT